MISLVMLGLFGLTAYAAEEAALDEAPLPGQSGPSKASER